MTATDCVIGVDGGNTKTLAVVADQHGRVIGVASGVSTDIYSGQDTAIVELLRVVGAAMAAADRRPEHCVAGVFSLAGADWPEDHVFLRDHLKAGLAFEVEPVVMNDSIGALRLASPAWEGVAVICGTGNAIGARHRNGEVFHLGFWPDPIGAVALSRAALDAVTRGFLGLGPPTSLTARALELYGRDDPIELLHFFTRRGGAQQSDLVRMSRPLFVEADGGDAVARSLVVGAGATLGAQARVAADRVGLGSVATTVLMAGGLFCHPSDLLEKAVMEELPEARGVRMTLPPVIGALLLALDRIGISSDPETVLKSMNRL